MGQSILDICAAEAVRQFDPAANEKSKGEVLLKDSRPRRIKYGLWLNICRRSR